MDGASTISVVPAVKWPANVRLAGPQDADNIYDLLMMAAEENAMATVYEARVREMIGNAVNRKGGTIGVIDGDSLDAPLAGCIGLMFAQYWYTIDWHIEDAACFVHPKYRSEGVYRGYARMLLKWAKCWADAMGQPLFVGVLSHKRTEGKVRLYRREFAQVGAVFVHLPSGRKPAGMA